MPPRHWFTLIALPVVSCGGLRAASPEAARELFLTNGGFEETSTKGIAGWQLHHWFKTPTQSVTLSEEEKRSGARALKIVLHEAISEKGYNEGTFQIGLSQRLPEVKSGTRLRVSFWYKTHASIPLEVAISGGSGCNRPVNRTSPWQTTSDGQWHRWEGDMDIRQFSADNVFYQGQIWLELLINGSVAPLPATLYLDDFSIETLDPGKALAESDPSWPGRLDRVRASLESAKVPKDSPTGSALKTDLLARASRLVEQTGQPLDVAGRASIETQVRDLEKQTDGLVSGDSLALEGVILSEVEAITNTRILPTDSLVPGRITREVKITAARGETESASFVLQAPTGIDALRLSPGPLTGADGQSLGTPDIRIVKSWYQDEAMQLRRTPPVGVYNPIDRGGFRILTPELLVHDDGLIRVDHATRDNFVKVDRKGKSTEICVSKPEGVLPGNEMEDFPVRDAASLQPLSIAKGENRQFWITVTVPKNATAGRYRSEVTVASGSKALGTFEITLEVLPFELPKAFAVNSIYYRPPSPQFYREQVWTQFRAEIGNLLAHGIDTPVLPLLFPLGSSRQAVVSTVAPFEVKEVLVADPTAKGADLPLLITDLRHKLDIMKEAGATSKKLFIDGLPVGYPEAQEDLANLEKRAGAVIALAREYGYEDVYFYGVDEARLSILTKQRPAWEAIKRAGGKIFAAGSADQFDVVGDLLDLSISIVPPDSAVAAKWHDKGHLIAAYGNPQGGVEQADTYRRNFGIGLWQAGFDGGMTYIYHNATIQNTRGVPADSHTISWASAWNDFSENPDRTKQHNMVYPTANGVLDTLQWEGYREGLDDVRYLRQLEELIARSQAPEDISLIAAKAWLKKLREEPINLGAESPAAIRSACIGHILNLLKAEPPKMETVQKE